MTPKINLTRPLATYQHIRRVGSVVFVAGQGCRDPETGDYRGLTLGAAGEIVRYDIKEQAKGVLLNIERALGSIGLNRAAIVDVQIYLTDMADFEKMSVPPDAK